MKIIIYQNREVSKENSKIGNDSENKVETLEFEFPEEYKDFTKYIEFQIKDEKYVDLIENDKYIITRAIAKYGKIKAQIVLRNSLENDVAVFKSDIFELKVSKSINATIDVPVEYPTWIDNLTKLKQDLDQSEQERVSNENERISAEKTRQENFTEMQETVSSAVSNIKDLTDKYNENDKQKTEAFNKNFEEKQKSINDNAESKIKAFDNNAEVQTKTFNTNSDDKLAEYNKNHTAKMKEFNDNFNTKTDTFNTNAKSKLDEYNKNTELKEKSFNDNAGTKTETFNTNAADKQNEFDENASDKLAEYNQNAKELINKVEQVQAENETLKAENKLIKEQIPSASASGNSIHVEDSGTLDFDWKIRGGHKQETREGYNLLDFNVTQDSRVTVNEDGTLTINGTGGFVLNIDKLQLKAGITYYQKVELISGSISGSNINNTFLSFAGAGAWISSENFSQTNLTKDTEKTTIWINASATFDNAVIKIWANTNKSDFEQYGASPSPDYPSEIETVGSNVNEFNCRDTYTSKGITLTKYIDGSFKVEGISTENSDFNFNIATYFKIKGKNTFKYEVLEGNSPAVWFWNSTDSNSNITLSKTNNSTVVTFEDEKELALNFTAVKGTTYSFTARMKIVKGKETGLYSPYRNGQCRNRCGK